jgi:SNF2 family DNA or RNA helicase
MGQTWTPAHNRDFGQVRFSALLFDEAQKIKTPGVRVTDAAKAMNPEFRLALTGTPVENRLADLW